MSVAPVLQLEAALLRRQLPDLLLRPGMTLFARVAERSGRHGIIVLAGSPLVAELPDEVQVGDKLRLLVEDTRGERVAMKLVQEQPAAGVAAPLASPVQEFDARVSVSEREADPDDPENASITIGYDSPALGAMAFALTIAPGSVTVRAEVGAGQPYELASEAADELRGRLAEVTGRAAEVTVIPRREPLDLYA
jgi:hypothetical protein